VALEVLDGSVLTVGLGWLSVVVDWVDVVFLSVALSLLGGLLLGGGGGGSLSLYRRFGLLVLVLVLELVEMGWIGILVVHSGFSSGGSVEWLSLLGGLGDLGDVGCERLVILFLIISLGLLGLLSLSLWLWACALLWAALLGRFLVLLAVMLLLFLLLWCLLGCLL